MIQNKCGKCIYFKFDQSQLVCYEIKLYATYVIVTRITCVLLYTLTSPID